MSEKKTLLKVENATMQFGGVVAVDNLNLEVNEGEIVALIGPNGAGKTTAFNVITGVYAPSNGRITFDGECIVRNHPTGKMKKLYKGKHPTMYTAQFAPEQALEGSDLETWKAEQKARDEFAFSDHILEPTPDKITGRGMARTFQNIRLFNDMTVLDNVKVGLHNQVVYGMWTGILRLPSFREKEHEMDRRAMKLLKIFDLDAEANYKASQLPYGKQRKLEIARALATNPKLLLLDEPAAGMNPNETEELMNTIHSVRDQFGVAILLIEHDMNFVMGICEEITVLDYGRVIARGDGKTIRNNPKVIAAYLGGDD